MRERERKGREHKKSGNVSFRGGQYGTAVEEFSQALKHMPWDVSLYTNRALVRMSIISHHQPQTPPTVYFTMLGRRFPKYCMNH